MVICLAHAHARFEKLPSASVVTAKRIDCHPLKIPKVI